MWRFWPIVPGAFGTITNGLLKGLEDLEVGRMGRDYPNDSIAENGQNPETRSWRLEETCCQSNFSEKTIC